MERSDAKRTVELPVNPGRSPDAAWRRCPVTLRLDLAAGVDLTVPAVKEGAAPGDLN